MNSYVLSFQEIDKTKLAIVGGKGANLRELSRIEGISVPEGFCVTTDAYKKIIEDNQDLNQLLDYLSLLQPGELEKISDISAKIRMLIDETAIEKEIEEQITQYINLLGEKNAYAVRSSATAEDLPTASFAGQQDTYLNIIGKDSILRNISKCWASLFTDRAVIYRMQNGFDHRQVHLSVVVQKMVFPQAAGIMFTADPVTSNHKVLSIDASFGLGEALVSGLVNADIYKVREGRIIDKRIATKKLAIYALEKGGTEEKAIEVGRQNMQTLTDEQILQLEGLGRKIEAHFGCPQDIEWCLYENAFYIVQSRPITTLYPIPEVNEAKTHVFMSMGHAQMMTDTIKPLGISFFQQLGSGDFALEEAGGRLFFDVAHDLASPVGRLIVTSTMGKNDPLTNNALQSLIKRKDFIKSLARGKRAISMGTAYFSWRLPIETIKIYRENNAYVVQTLMLRNEASISELREKIARVSGEDLFSFIIEDQQALKEIMYNPRSMGTIFAGVYAASWLNKNLEKWLGEKGAADVLSQSVANNVTSEMGLALLDVADVARLYPAVIEYFEHAANETFFTDLAELEGGGAVINSIQAFLDKYGMRCSGEIDITRTRWGEQPIELVPMILSNIKNFQPGAHRFIFEQKLRDAKDKEMDIIKQLEKLPGGQRKAKKIRKNISILRNFIGYREYPKYAFMQRYYIYKQALLKEAAVLVKEGVVRKVEDVYYLSFDEFRNTVKTKQLNYAIIKKRKADYEVYEKLTPPRMITSEGEIISGEYEAGNRPEGALPGLAVSSGVIEGRARVVTNMVDARIEDGDILVTSFTDPSWTPLFVSIKGLVTEVGGLMTHGAVIAREYGLPAVVCVENATRLIKDGQKIRINGSEGYVEILDQN